MKTTFLTTCLLLSFGLTCLGESVDGYLMPAKCHKEDVKAHRTECALICQSSGFGVVTGDGQYIGFTPDGNKKAIAMLQSTSKTADLRVSVQGTRQAALLAVESIAWQ
jgi:hypothetical protein